MQSNRRKGLPLFLLASSLFGGLATLRSSGQPAPRLLGGYPSKLTGVHHGTKADVLVSHSTPGGEPNPTGLSERVAATLEPAERRVHVGPEVPPPTIRATLAGRITEGGSEGVSARIEFESGLNAERSLRCSPSGTFAATDLHPGFQLLAITVPGYPVCKRELFLPPYRETLLELDFGAARLVRGWIRDEHGQPVPAAEVALDGNAVWTDSSGRFLALQHASGPASIVVRAEGFAHQRQVLRSSEPDDVQLTLTPACTLELQVGPVTAGPYDAVIVYLRSRGAQKMVGRPPQPATPWFLFSPLRCAPGDSVRVTNLPAGELEVLAFHPRARGVSAPVWTDPGHAASVSIVMKPLATLQGRVTRAGAALSNAAVRLVSGQPVRELVAASTGLGDLPRLQPLTWLPSTAQHTTTALDGSFTLGWWPYRPSSPFLTVEDRAGSTWTQAVDGSAVTIDW